MNRPLIKNVHASLMKRDNAMHADLAVRKMSELFEPFASRVIDGIAEKPSVVIEMEQFRLILSIIGEFTALLSPGSEMIRPFLHGRR